MAARWPISLWPTRKIRNEADLAFGRSDGVFFASGVLASAAELSSCGGAGFVPARAANAHVAGDYPPLSLVLHEEGTTVLAFVIDETGAVTEPSVAVSSGSLRLDAAALESVMQNWHYVPAMRDGKPLRCPWKAQVVWDISNSNADASLDMLRKFVTVIEAKPSDFPIGAWDRGEHGDAGFRVMHMIGQSEPGIEMVKPSGFVDLDTVSQVMVRQKVKTVQCTLNGAEAACQMLVVVAWRHPPAVTPPPVSPVSPQSTAPKP